MSVRFTHNILVPGWIMLVGLIFLNAPPLGAVVSVSVFMAGILVIPALVLVPRIFSIRALARTRSQIVRTWRRSSPRRR
jgi:hypothetical protein